MNPPLLPGVVALTILGLVSTAGLTPAQEVDSLMPDLTLTAPSGLSATSSGSSQVNLIWIDKAVNEIGYRVERREGQVGTFAEVANLGLDKISYLDAGFPETEYCYRVVAFNTVGDSAFSNVACDTTDPVAFVACTPDEFNNRRYLVTVLTDPVNADWRAEVGLSGADPNELLLLTDDAICDALWRKHVVVTFPPS